MSIRTAPSRSVRHSRAPVENVALVADADTLDPERGAVTLMTLHAAKGLEYPLVAIVGLEEGKLPHARAFENPDEAEEERRLCFVGITRAERTLLLMHTASRLMHGMRQACIESRFLRELPDEHVERIDLAEGIGGGGGGFDDMHDFNGGRGFGGARRDASGSSGGSFSADGERVFRVDRSEDWHSRGRPSSTPAAGRGSGAARLGGGTGGTLGGLSVGTMVRHPIFGIGRVTELLPRAGSSSVRVQFNTAGLKTLVLAYAKLEKLG